MRFQSATLSLLCGICICISGCGTGVPGLDPNAYVVEHTDYHPPEAVDGELIDDLLVDKKTSFNPELVDRRPLDGWLVNQSEAVIRLDVPLIKPDIEPRLLVLHPSYVAASESAKAQLPSVNLIDGKAKQFDDGLYAAIEQAQFQGVAERLPGNLKLIERLLASVAGDSSAAAYLAAGLSLGGRETMVKDDEERQTFINEFQADLTRSKPLGFYNWNDTLKHCWAFMQFFQKPLPADSPVVMELLRALQADLVLAADCQQAARFFATLTNPFTAPTIGDLVVVDEASRETLDASGANQVKENVGIPSVSLFPASTSRETELFNRLFPLGVPAGSDLMRELVKRIRSGEVDLSPRKDSGWYDYQVHALETMLLPERGEAHEKLLLTKSYKMRMLNAFSALITKRRETHVRQLEVANPTSMVPMKPQSVSPRLRVEPCPSYYLRVARSYAFLQSFLVTTLEGDVLKELHGLRNAGERSDDLATELAGQRDLFYGLYIVSCDDIGHRPSLHDGEVAEPERCYDAAIAWLQKVEEKTDADLAEDTRVVVPVYVDPVHGKMRLWVTLGVRLTRLETSYVRAPQIKPADGTGDWQMVDDAKLAYSDYEIAVDEFAEVEIPRLAAPNREEFRKICDDQKTKAKILETLASGKW